VVGGEDNNLATSDDQGVGYSEVETLAEKKVHAAGAKHVGEGGGTNESGEVRFGTSRRGGGEPKVQ